MLDPGSAFDSSLFDWEGLSAYLPTLSESALASEGSESDPSFAQLMVPTFLASDSTSTTGSGSKIDFETKSFLITLAFNLFCFFVTIFSFGWLREKRSDALTDQQKALLRSKSVPAEGEKGEKSKRKKSVDADRRHPSV